jgi:tRNA 2-selenouridine synthase
LIHKLNAEEFLKERASTVLLDVRSPSEYERGHIPGAISTPLFSNEERQTVGTIYKQKGRDLAIEKGLEFVSNKVMGMLETIKKLSLERRVLLYCWRGGMRSGSIAWMLDLYGFHVSVLKGGYKAYRHFQDVAYSNSAPFMVLGGYTGSGKTEILRELRNRGEQLLDLEDIAKHRGSAFGAIGMPEQPGSEHFTNLLFDAFLELDQQRCIWIEDESKAIGRVHLSPVFFEKLKSSPMLMIDIPLPERVILLEKEYGFIPENLVREVIDKVSKRMGGQHVNTALQALDQGDRNLVVEQLLIYYDRAYRHSMSRHKREITILNLSKADIDVNCEAILEWKQQQKKR